MERLDVTILGREYTLLCAPEEAESLAEAAVMVERTTQRIKAAGKVSVSERIAVMAAIQLAGELLAARAPDGSLSQLAINDYKRRIEDMNSVIDSAFKQQDKLF